MTGRNLVALRAIKLKTPQRGLSVKARTRRRPVDNPCLQHSWSAASFRFLPKGFLRVAAGPKKKTIGTTTGPPVVPMRGTFEDRKANDLEQRTPN